MNYYNEFDPAKAAMLRQLISEKLIPEGDVDERDIREVHPNDLLGYGQCHFFAGFGGWCLALQYAGWPEDRPVWTGSCPCPPFSSAGKRKNCPGCGAAKPISHPRRTGFFVCTGCRHEWFADERHLWPEFSRLIRVCRPPAVFGEQVASADGRVWLTGVRADLETMGYASGAADLCAAGVGAPHIRQRLWWVAYPESIGRGFPHSEDIRQAEGEIHSSRHDSIPDGMGDPHHHQRPQGYGFDGERAGQRIAGATSDSGGMGNSEELGRHDSRNDKDAPEWHDSAIGVRGASGRLEHPESDGREQRRPESGKRSVTGGCGESIWSDYDLIPCTDGKARRAESGTFPLAHGDTERVPLLHAAGDGIVPQVAAQFIAACEEASIIL